MIAKVLTLLVALTALAGPSAGASYGVAETVSDFLDIMVEEQPRRAAGMAELLIDMYESNASLRDERILQCLREVRRCWKDVVSDAAARPLCVATARKCRTLVLAASKPPVPLQIEVPPPRKLILYKTLDLCGESFNVSQLLEAAATDAHLAQALRYMEQKDVNFSSYCFVDFYAETGSRTLSFDPSRFEKGTFLGSPSPENPSYQVTIDATTGQITLGHYQK